MATQALERPAFEGVYEIPEAANYLRVTMPHIPSIPQKLYSGKLIRRIRNGVASPSLVQVSGYDFVNHLRGLNLNARDSIHAIFRL